MRRIKSVSNHTEESKQSLYLKLFGFFLDKDKNYFYIYESESVNIIQNLGISKKSVVK